MCTYLYLPLIHIFQILGNQYSHKWIVIIAIFVFYCIPKSKRSVYVLPIYPFMACLLYTSIMNIHRNVLIRLGINFEQNVQNWHNRHERKHIKRCV